MVEHWQPPAQCACPAGAGYTAHVRMSAKGRLTRFSIEWHMNTDSISKTFAANASWNIAAFSIVFVLALAVLWAIDTIGILDVADLLDKRNRNYVVFYATSFVWFLVLSIISLYAGGALERRFRRWRTGITSRRRRGG